MVVLLGGLKELCICLNICYRDYNGMLRLYNLTRNNEGVPYVLLTIMVLDFDVSR